MARGRGLSQSSRGRLLRRFRSRRRTGQGGVRALPRARRLPRIRASQRRAPWCLGRALTPPAAGLYAEDRVMTSWWGDEGTPALLLDRAAPLAQLVHADQPGPRRDGSGDAESGDAAACP